MKSRCRGLLLSLTPIRTFFINNDGTGGHTTLYHNDLAKRSTSLKTRFKKRCSHHNSDLVVMYADLAQEASDPNTTRVGIKHDLVDYLE